MKKVLKLAIAVKGDNAPVFMEGEKPGVFATQVIEVEVTDSDMASPMFAKWMIDKEEDLMRDTIEFQWQEEVQVEDPDDL